MRESWFSKIRGWWTGVLRNVGNACEACNIPVIRAIANPIGRVANKWADSLEMTEVTDENTIDMEDITFSNPETAEFFGQEVSDDAQVADDETIEISDDMEIEIDEEDLMVDEAEDQPEKKPNIFVRVITAIGSGIKKVWNFITTPFRKLFGKD